MIRNDDVPSIIVITYEFCFSTFSGNGVLAQSLVHSLVLLGCEVTVWCCRPYEDDGDVEAGFVELFHENLKVITTRLSKAAGWRRLDKQSGWREFTLESLDPDSRLSLELRLSAAQAACVVDWTGAHAWRSLPCNLPLIYLNFRVYSSGVSELHEWYDEMERQALQEADLVVALSDHDLTSLQKLVPDRSMVVLWPPLRGEMERLSHSWSQSVLPLPIALPNYRPERCLITCMVRLSPEKETMRFVSMCQALLETIHQNGYIPLLAGASSDADYAEKVWKRLSSTVPSAIIVRSFLTPANMAALWSRTALNIHPCTYDAYGMTIIEAASFGVPSIVNATNVHEGDETNHPLVGATATLRSDGFIGVSWDKEGDALETIRQCLLNPQKLENVGAKARERAISWDEAAYGSTLLRHVGQVVSRQLVP